LLQQLRQQHRLRLRQTGLKLWPQKTLKITKTKPAFSWIFVFFAAIHALIQQAGNE
jgi:hypothetical protein